MLVTKIIETEMKEVRANGRDVLYYFGWNYDWQDEYVTIGHVGEHYYEAFIKCEYGTLDSNRIAHITTRDILYYLSKTGLMYEVTCESNIATEIKIMIPTKDGMWKGYDEYQDEIMTFEALGYNESEEEEEEN